MNTPEQPNSPSDIPRKRGRPRTRKPKTPLTDDERKAIRSNGAKHAAATTRQRRGIDFFRIIGKKGGENAHKNDPDRLKRIGRKGGKATRKQNKPQQN